MIHDFIRNLLVAATAVVTLAIAPVVYGARATPPLPDLTQGGKIPEGGLDVTHDWNLGPTGARGWVYGWAGNTSAARQILVTEVAKGSPADGVLSSGDVILGIGGRPFDRDARIAFAKAIAAAEEERAGGLLALIRWRAGQTQNVQLKLPVMGTYSDTAPYDCPKSKKIFERGCQAIAQKGLGGVSIPDDLTALALLASGKEEYRPMLAQYAKKVAAFQTDSFATWLYGYANMFLAEYVIATHDVSVLDGVKRLALEAAKGQSIVGTWGHKFARPDGHLNGYGCMNQPGLSLTISMVLARQAGVKSPALDRAITNAAGFLHWYTDKGAIPYGDHQPWPWHEDNGKCSSAAVLFDLLGDRAAAGFFSRMATAAYDERETGHTGCFFNVLWAMPGVSRGGPLATSAYWKEQSWYYDLARRWDGSFPYQGEAPGGQEHGKHTSWDCTGLYLLAYALPLKSLYLTGKGPSAAPALNATEVKEVIAAGRDFFPVNGQNGYDLRPTDTLLAGLTSWSPAMRKRSAQALGRRPGDFVPALTKMLASTDRDTRYGACEALGCLGARADAAAPQLRALLAESDPWLQSLAANSLLMLGSEARTASVPDLLNMAQRDNPADPRRMAQRAACSVLFARPPGTRDVKPILADSLAGVDRQVLFPVVKSALENQDSVVRAAIARGVYDKLTDRELAELLPAIITAVRELAPSDEMFGDGVRLAGLDLLSKHHIAEGMPLCVAVIEPERWGSGGRFAKCLEYLRRYGGNARDLVPALQKLRAGVVKEAPANKKISTEAALIDNLIAAIQADKNPPKLQTAAEFSAKK